jgi:hypothetical protein
MLADVSLAALASCTIRATGLPGMGLRTDPHRQGFMMFCVVIGIYVECSVHEESAADGELLIDDKHELQLTQQYSRNTTRIYATDNDVIIKTADFCRY